LVLYHKSYLRRIQKRTTNQKFAINCHPDVNPLIYSKFPAKKAMAMEGLVIKP